MGTFTTRVAYQPYESRYSITFHYDAPNPLGSGDYKFAGIDLYIHRLGDDVIDFLGYKYFGGAVEEPVEFSAEFSLPEEDDTWRFYAVSRSDKHVNDLVLKGEDDETPFVDVSVSADPHQGVDAPDALVFKVGTLELDGSYTLAPRWDHTVKNLLFDWGAVIQEDISNWSSLVIFIKTADETYVQSTGEHYIDAFTVQDDGTYAIRGTISISGADLPATPETWTFIACSRNDSGYLNVDVGNDPIGPGVVIDTISPYAPQVTGATALQGTGEYTEQGEETYYFYGTYTAPSDPLWESVEVTALWDGDSVEIVLGRYGADGDWQTDAWPLFQARDVDIKFYSVSTGGLRNEASPPLVEFTVSPTVGSAGIEYAPLVTSPTAVRISPTRYGDTTNFNTPGGVELYGFDLGWTCPASVLYSGVKIYCEFSNGNKVLLAVEEKPSVTVITDEWPTGPSTFTVDIWFVSFRGVLDNTFESGVTPKIQVQITVATPGTVKGEKVTDIPIASFAAGIKPVELVTTLPSLPSADYPVGTPVFKTNDDPPRLYRVDTGGNTWTAEVDGNDLIAASVIAGKIAAGAVSTTELYAGEIKLGGGGGKPGKLGIYNASDVQVGFLGLESTSIGLQLYSNGITTTLTNESVGGTPTGLRVAHDSSGGEARVGLSGGHPRIWLGGEASVGTLTLQCLGSGQGGYITLTDTSSTSGVEIQGEHSAYPSGVWRGRVTAGGVNCVRELLIASTQVIDSTRNILNVVNITITGYLDAVSYVDAAGGFKVSGTTKIGSSGELIPRYFSQAGRPTLTDGETALWYDTSDFWLLSRIGANYFKVQMNVA